MKKMNLFRSSAPTHGLTSFLRFSAIRGTNMVVRARRSAAIALILLSSITVLSQEKVLFCRRPGINGMDENAAHAHPFLPPNTSDISKAVIYVEKTRDGLYFHSNFVTPGFDNPTKALIKEDTDFRTVFVNLIYGNDFSHEEAATALKAYKDKVRILLDESMFTEGGYPLIDIGEATNVSIVEGRSGKTLVGPVERLDRASPPPVLMSRVVGCCLFGIPPHLSGRYQQALEARALVRNDVRFLSLVRDSGTELAIRNSNALHSVRLGDPGVAITNLGQIENAFRSAQGNTVVLMSHVEGANFVTRDAARNIVSSIAVESVRSLATKYNVELIDLGCETAQLLRAEKLGIGVTSKFNTVDAVRALDRALSNSSNYSQFFQSLTSENLRVVVDHGFMQHWPLCADVYAKANTFTSNPVWVKLARIFVNFRESRTATNSFAVPEGLQVEANALFKESHGQ